MDSGPTVAASSYPGALARLSRWGWSVTVFDDLVGQRTAVDHLRRAVAGAADLVAGGAGAGMTHAWLFTGPPGSGRSEAARAFAAALQCRDGGCGHCDSCHQVMAGTHPDMLYVRPSGLSFGVAATRELVLRAGSKPSGGRFRIVLFEDAERATEAASNALLKAVEEPSPRTVWLLCTPTPDDLLVTIRSRCRLVTLATPATAEIVAALTRSGEVDEHTARAAAVASAGRVDRARQLATDPEARRRREEVLSIPARLDGIGACVTSAARLYEIAEQESKAITAALDDKEKDELRAAFGEGSTGKGVAKAMRGSAGAMKDLEERQKRRATRIKRDSYDRALLDLAAFYRDVLTLQLGASVERSTGERSGDLERIARTSSPETSLRRIDAIMECRERIAANVHPQIAMEAMTSALLLG